MSTLDNAGNYTAEGLRPEPSLVQRGMNGDRAAIETMFRTFLADDERMVAAQYLGIKGMLGFGEKSFACVTNNRVARIEIGFFGAMEYQEALIRDVNSIYIKQPSRAWLFVIFAAVVLLAFATFGLALLLIPFVPRIYYRFFKSGFVLGVREGIFLYAFADRARLPRVKLLLTEITPRR